VNKTCLEWLREFLQVEGCVLCDVVREEALNMGYTRQELKEARRQLKVKTYHQFDESGPTPNYFWYLED